MKRINNVQLSKIVGGKEIGTFFRMSVGHIKDRWFDNGDGVLGSGDIVHAWWEAGIVKLPDTNDGSLILSESDLNGATLERV
jgi:hypothetical protein